MKTRTIGSAIAFITAVFGVTVSLWAAETSGVKNAAPSVAASVARPTLKVDPSPISEQKSGVVTSYADALDGIRPAVVSVYSSKIVHQQVPEFIRQYGLKGREQKQSGLGSGVIISTDGYIITNNHVVEEADILRVRLNDDREFTAKVIGTDPKTDVAVIKIDGEDFPAATLADSSVLRVGDVVFAIGNPLGVGQTVTMGIVSATNRQVRILDEVHGYEDFIQTDASINQGNSGGALSDARGRLIGINSAIISTTQGSVGIGFAIPINLASSIMHSLIETGTVARGCLGVTTDLVDAATAESLGLKRNAKGVIIRELKPADGPAAKAGLRSADIVIAINDHPVTTTENFRLVIAQTPPATRITLKYIRDGKVDTREVVLGKMPDDDASEGELFTGVSVSTLTGELRQELRLDKRVEGLLVTEVAENSPYRDVLPPGAVIEQLNKVAVTDLVAAKRALRDGRNLLFYYFHGTHRFITISRD